MIFIGSIFSANFAASLMRDNSELKGAIMFDLIHAIYMLSDDSLCLLWCKVYIFMLNTYARLVRFYLVKYGCSYATIFGQDASVTPDLYMRIKSEIIRNRRHAQFLNSMIACDRCLITLYKIMLFG